jgi:hypothetical protein
MPEVKSHETLISYDDRGRGEPALLFMPGGFVWVGAPTAAQDRGRDHAL